MSGITGVFQRTHEPVHSDVLRRMTDEMLKRGPDRQNIWFQEDVGLGHAALFSTIEAEYEDQPVTLDGEVWITGDARIDEWDELRRKLEAKGQALPVKITDIELILHAYLVWGAACVGHLLGDFAFVIWDGRNQWMYCARDHAGVKPFYYHLSDGVFAFGSEVRAVLAMPDVPKRMNEARIADSMIDVLEGVDKTSTFFLDIQRLPPAHYMIVGRETMRQVQYWSLDASKEIRLKSDREYADAFLEVFSKAVICRLRSPERVGSMLSGGLDSSSVVAVARKWLSENGYPHLKTFSAVSDSGDDIESRSSRAVAIQGGVEWHTVRPQEMEQYLTDFQTFDQFGDFLFDYSQDVPQLMYMMAKRQNLKAMLDGTPGDNVTSVGWYYLTDIFRRFQLIKAVRECHALSRYWQEESAQGLFWRYAKSAYVAPWMVNVKHAVFGVPQKTIDLTADSFINRDFARRVHLHERYARATRYTPAGRLTTRERHRFGLEWAILPAAYERYDRVASAHSIEARHPYSDRRLIEFCLALPDEQKNDQGLEKMVNRRAVEIMLPHEVAWRTESTHLGFDFSVARFRSRHTDILRTLRSERMSLIAPYIDSNKAETIVQAVVNFTYEQTFDILRLYTIANWFWYHHLLIH